MHTHNAFTLTPTPDTYSNMSEVLLLSTFITAITPTPQFDMVSIQNATLAGGVAVGSSADLVIQPWGAILIGMVAGTLSVLGYAKIQPMLSSVGLDDTCGNARNWCGLIAALIVTYWLKSKPV